MNLKLAWRSSIIAILKEKTENKSFYVVNVTKDEEKV